MNSTSSQIHNFLVNHPVGRAISAHTRYGPGHPVYDAHTIANNPAMAPPPSMGTPPPGLPGMPPPNVPGGNMMPPPSMPQPMQQPPGQLPSIINTPRGPMNPHLHAQLMRGMTSPGQAMPPGGRPAQQQKPRPRPSTK